MCVVLHLSVTWLPWAWQTNREMVRAKAQERDRDPSSSLLRLEGCLSALPLSCLAQCVWFTYCHDSPLPPPNNCNLKGPYFVRSGLNIRMKVNQNKLPCNLCKSSGTVIRRSQRGVMICSRNEFHSAHGYNLVSLKSFSWQRLPQES